MVEKVGTRHRIICKIHLDALDREDDFFLVLIDLSGTSIQPTEFVTASKIFFQKWTMTMIVISWSDLMTAFHRHFDSRIREKVPRFTWVMSPTQ